MGYRSDVMAAFYVQDKKHLPVLKLWMAENFPMDDFENALEWSTRGVIFKDEQTKWYDDYDDVKAFNEAVGKFLELIYGNRNEPQPDAPVFSFEFVRVGENYDDIEVQYEGDACEWVLGVRREITMDGELT